MMKFSQFGLHKKILKGIEKAGFTECLPVQEKTYTETLIHNRDVCVQSQTGTGKTAAFLIPIFQLLITDDFFRNKKALIVAPTRELAIQIEKEAGVLGHYLDLTTGCFYGGMGYSKQEKILERGVDIVIGTPGRLIDFNQKGKLDFKQLGILIIDEADRLFDMGFLPDIRKMLKKMPPYNKRRTMLFSATLDYLVKELAWEHMNDPVEIETTPEQITVENITQELYHVGREEKMALLLGLLKGQNPENVLIFTNTKHMAYEVSKRLSRNGYDCKYIMGDLPQKKRLQVIDGIKSGKIKYLVATDVAARGLHIEDLDLVVNYDLPMDCESYVHRIGRTARAGKSGKAISFACEQFVLGLSAIESLISMKIPVVWPDESCFVEDKSAGMRFRMEKFRKIDTGDVRSRPHRKSSKKPSHKPKTKGTSVEFASKKRPKRKKPSSPIQSAEKKDLRHKRRAKNPQESKSARPVGRKSKLEDRIEYYKEKYGEDFRVISDTGPETSEPDVTTPKKKPFLSKLFSVFDARHNERDEQLPK